MKKLNEKRRQRDVLDGIDARRRHTNRAGSCAGSVSESPAKSTKIWFEHNKHLLNYEVVRKRQIRLTLPEEMNFSNEFDNTSIHLEALRFLCHGNTVSKKTLRIVYVDFSNLKTISSSAALVLTAELSRWDDCFRRDLKPQLSNWNPEIIDKFYQLGFFDLFPSVKKEANEYYKSTNGISTLNYIKAPVKSSINRKYSDKLKGFLQEHALQHSKKWAFLHAGLTEAALNVAQHAYPTFKNGQSWYVSGFYYQNENKLKIIFYDQGIGIPRSLPSSSIKEMIYEFLDSFDAVERRRHPIMIKAAVQAKRSSTNMADRGEGFLDMMNYIEQSSEGYMSVMSGTGLYKYVVSKGTKVNEKTVSFRNRINGTLVIWSIDLGSDTNAQSV